jgi:hypothetical protein
MKRHFLFVLCLTVSVFVFAQDENEEETKGFKKENLFVGGSLSLSFSSNAFGIGVTPEFGYSVAKWIDAGIVANYNYTSYRNYPITFSQLGTLRQTIYGGGAFTRIFPVRFLFLQGQFEHNWIALKYIPNGGGNTEKVRVDASSLLVGAGYTTGRDPLNKSAYGYFAILFDALNDENSPYVNYDYDINGNPTGTSKVPIIRAGLIVPLFQGKNRDY